MRTGDNASQCQSTLRKFVAFIKGQNSKAEEMAHVNRSLVRAFMDAETARGVTAKTWNDTLKLLRATFKYLLPAGAINPFSDMPTHETERAGVRCRGSFGRCRPFRPIGPFPQQIPGWLRMLRPDR